MSNGSAIDRSLQLRVKTRYWPIRSRPFDQGDFEMAATRRGGRRARKPNTTTAKRAVAKRAVGRPARRATTDRSGAVIAFLDKGRELISTMHQHGIAGVEKVQAALGETAQQLVGAGSFTAPAITNSVRRVGVRATRIAKPVGPPRAVRVPNNKLTVAQQSCLNAINPNE